MPEDVVEQPFEQPRGYDNVVLTYDGGISPVLGYEEDGIPYDAEAVPYGGGNANNEVEFPIMALISGRQKPVQYEMRAWRRSTIRGGIRGYIRIREEEDLETLALLDAL